MNRIREVITAVLFFAMISAHGAEIETNSIRIPDAPSWLKASRVDRVVSRIQDKLEWDIRKVNVIWYTDERVFEKAHGFDSSVLAFSVKSDSTIHIGPKIDEKNFDGIFAHELVHCILYQKYRDAIPKWLDEGLANYFGQNSKVDYKWLATQPFHDVTRMGHPFKNTTGVSSKYHYQASTAVIEMIASKCSLEDLLQLSVGKNLESYLSTFCELPDLNVGFQAWVKKKGTI